MKANELRIGNLVEYEATTHIVMAIHPDICNSIWHRKRGEIYTHDYSEIKPIPLTEEWLLNKTDLINGIGYHNDKISGLINVKFNSNLNKFELYIGSIFICFVDFIHELQNIVFALTGEELILKQ